MDGHDLLTGETLPLKQHHGWSRSPWMVLGLIRCRWLDLFNLVVVMVVYCTGFGCEWWFGVDDDDDDDGVDDGGLV